MPLCYTCTVLHVLYYMLRPAITPHTVFGTKTPCVARVVKLNTVQLLDNTCQKNLYPIPRVLSRRFHCTIASQTNKHLTNVFKSRSQKIFTRNQCNFTMFPTSCIYTDVLVYYTFHNGYCLPCMNTIRSNRMSVQISNRLHLQITHDVISQQLTFIVGNDLPPLTPAAHLVDLPSDFDFV